MAGQGGVFSSQGQVTLEGKPFVATFLNDEPFGQLSPEEAIAMGIRTISSAIEAERDAGLIRFLKDEGKLDDEAIGVLLVGMRDFREQYDPPQGLGN